VDYRSSERRMEDREDSKEGGRRYERRKKERELHGELITRGGEVIDINKRT
jgi:hypothetical protein